MDDSERVKAEADTPQPPRRGVPDWWLALAGWLASFGAWLAVAGSWMVLGGVAVLALLLARTLPGGWAGRGLVFLVGLATGLALATEWELREIDTRWPAMVESIENRSAGALRQDLDGAVDRMEIAIDGAISQVIERAPNGFVDLDPLRRSAGVSAVAVFDRQGRLVSWGGEHRGPVMPGLGGADAPYAYHDGPIFQYLYSVRSVPGGWRVVAAVLLDSEVDIAVTPAPLADRFERRHGIRPVFSDPELARGPAVWDWAIDGAILSASFPQLTRSHARERAVRRGGRVGGVLWFLVFVFGAAQWWRRPDLPRGAPLLFAVGCSVFLLIPGMPVAEAVGVSSALTAWVGFLASAAICLVILAGRAPPDGSPSYPRLPAVLAAAALLPGVMVVARTFTDRLDAWRAVESFPLYLATTTLVAIGLYLIWPRAESGRRGRRLWLWTGLVLAGLLSFGSVAYWAPGRPLPDWLPILWAVPYAICLLATAAPRSLRWLAAGVIAATTVLPFVWAADAEARIAVAEGELATLGVEPLPELEHLLRQFAEETRVLRDEGEEGVNLLYRAWIGSGLARTGRTMRLALLDAGSVVSELRFGDVPFPVDLVEGPLEAIHPETAPFRIERFTDRPEVHYLLMAALDEDRALLALLPPRETLHGPEGTAVMLAPDERERVLLGDATLTLVPDHRPPGSLLRRAPDGTRPVVWHRTPTGWQSEKLVDYPVGVMHAHLEIRTGSAPVLLARTGLRLVLATLAMLLIWGLALVLAGRGGRLVADIRRWGATFRGRLSAALLLFFFIPTLVLGYVAFEGLSREVFRGATERASWVLEQAAAAAGAERLPALASRLRSELLLYEGAVLTDAGSPEILDLGLYPGWLSTSVWREIGTGERLQVTERRVLAGRDLLIVYRRAAPGEVLAVPMPVAAAEIEERRREFAEVILFALLLGGVLSAILAFFVGRTLSRPIDEVTAAAVRVGRGDFDVRLSAERTDEFGVLHTAFNRMVARLRRARTALLREKRRTEAIVRGTATGVLALDHEGRIALVNPAARHLLGADLVLGSSLIEAGDPTSAEIERLVRRARSTPRGEAGAEVESGGRILRVQARRLRRAGTRSGSVVTVEDITAEIRTARILAWGEMAQQVAHEIKNPLTPIKLGVQHIQRAYRDGRSDYPEILDRNVEATLREIDRLGRIARGFARFGAPRQTDVPVGSVDALRILRDAVELYRTGDDRIRYELDLPSGLPPVAARDDEFREVISNLLENAREALMPTGGIVRVRAQPEGADRVLIEVEDTGDGVPAELLERVFEPHFSTRTSGSGLGLAIVRRLVESWRGEVDIRSEPGQGAVVRVTLSRASEG